MINLRRGGAVLLLHLRLLSLHFRKDDYENQNTNTKQSINVDIEAKET